MHFSSIRTPSVNNLYILAESTFLSFALAANKMWNKEVVNIQVEYNNDDMTVYGLLELGIALVKAIPHQYLSKTKLDRRLVR